MSAVRQMFGDDVPSPVQTLPTRWSQNPLFEGAYSYTSVGVTPSDYDDLGNPIEDVLLLAGEHTIFKYHLTTHGAFLTGVRAANEIDKRFA